MKKITCPKKGNKLAQQKNCECDNFNLFINKSNNLIAKCIRCETVYNLDCLKKI